jgi:predicted phosphodiesterase
MRILTLADIHFKSDEHDSPHDSYAHVRDAFFNAIATLKSEAPIDLILIAGDIAFAGRAEEYKIAEAFLEKIKQSLGLHLVQVVVAPGNHDFDRSQLKRDPMLGFVHDVAKRSFRKGDQGIAGAYAAWLKSETSRAALLSPFAEFQKFAQDRGGALNANGSVDPTILKLADGVELRVFPLSSAAFASSDEDRGSLCVDPGYNAIRRDANGVLNLALMHHPPAWSSNAADVQLALRLRADIVVVGHEHTQQNYQIGDRTMWVDAGSLQPELNGSEPPCFSVLDLSAGAAGDRINVAAALSVYRYRRTEDKFILESGAAGGPTYLHKFEVAPKLAPAVEQSAGNEKVGVSLPEQMQPPRMQVRADFFKLIASDRDIVCDALGVERTGTDEASDVAAQRQWTQIESRGLLQNALETMVRLRIARGTKNGI